VWVHILVILYLFGYSLEWWIPLVLCPSLNPLGGDILYPFGIIFWVMNSYLSFVSVLSLLLLLFFFFSVSMSDLHKPLITRSRRTRLIYIHLWLGAHQFRIKNIREMTWRTLISGHPKGKLWQPFLFFSILVNDIYDDSGMTISHEPT
jgi:hypothetical protein